MNLEEFIDFCGRNKKIMLKEEVKREKKEEIEQL